MSYYYIMSCFYTMSGINKALNAISHYIITLWGRGGTHTADHPVETLTGVIAQIS